MRRAILVMLALAPSAALAQVTVTESAANDLFINIAECQGTQTQDFLSFTWNFPGFVAGGTYTLTASDTNLCPASTTTQSVRNVTINSNIPATSSSGAFPSTVGTSVFVTTLLPQLGIPTSCNATTSAIFFCVTLSNATTGAIATGSIGLDLLNPPRPVITGVAPSDSALSVSWQRGSGGTADAGTAGSTDSFRITATAVNNPADTHSTGFISPGSSTGGRVGGLTNDVAYNVTVEAFSPGRNASGASDPVVATPVVVNDFWRLYRNDGGREAGGCSFGAAGMLALLAVPLALRAWRRRS